MAIKHKCGRCGRFVPSGDTCCGEIKQIKIEKRKPKPEDEFDNSKNPDAKSLAEALFGPGGELVEEELPKKKGKKDGKGIRKGNEGGGKEGLKQQEEREEVLEEE